MTKEKNQKKQVNDSFDLSDKDEYSHDWGKFPPFHNESWYFNFIDRPNNVFFITRLSYNMDKKKSLVLVLPIIDGKVRVYFKEIPLEKMPTDWEIDNKVKYYCIKPMKQWRIKFKNSQVDLDVNLEGRFPVFNSAEGTDPLAFLKEDYTKTEQVFAQMHYEQPMIATGTLIMKKKGEVIETRTIKGFGHRDHSWGVREWGGIDSWNWVVAQFEDETINFYKAKALGEVKQDGIIYSKGADNIRITNIEVTTKTKENEKTPVSSIFIITDENGKKRTIESKTIFSQYLPLPSEKGLTEVYEQVAIFTFNGKEGDGISEYLSTTRK
ncbi:hypothetical protein ES705_28588 [subsurface metagenome]